MPKVPEKLGAEYYRELLTKQGKMIYDCINTQLLNGNYSGKSFFPLCNLETSAKDSFAAYKAIRDDHPEYFFLGFQSEFTSVGYKGSLNYPLLYNSETINRIQHQVRKSVFHLVRGTSNLQMVEREMLVYERISKRLTYKNNGDVRDHNIVGPVLLSAGVCEGYNALLMLCFRRIGIPCIKIYGKTNMSRSHCWTIAWINGISVHCDVTWDGAKEGIISFDYLNLSDNQIANDHYDFIRPSIPKCTTDKLSCYYESGASVNSFIELRSHVKDNVLKGVKKIMIHFNYYPLSGDYMEEVKTAFEIEQIYINFKIIYNPTLKNVVVKII